MSARAATWIAWSMWAISLPFAAFGGGVLGFLSASARIFPSLGTIVLLALLALTFTTVGAVVASRRPENPIGWIFCAGGLILSVTVSAENYTEYALNASTGSLPGVQYAAWIASWALAPTLLLVATMLFLLFPDGKLSSREWGFVAWTAVVASVVVALGDALGRSNLGTDYGSMGNPFAVEGAVGNFLQMLGGFGLTFLLVFPGLRRRAVRSSAPGEGSRAPADQVVRLRRSGDGRRSAGDVYAWQWLLSASRANVGPGLLRGHSRFCVPPRCHSHSYPQVPPLRHRPHHQPHPGLRRFDGDAGRSVRGQRIVHSVRFPRAHGKQVATGDSGIYTLDSGTFQPLETSNPVLHRQALLP